MPPCGVWVGDAICGQSIPNGWPFAGASNLSDINRFHFLWDKNTSRYYGDSSIIYTMGGIQAYHDIYDIEKTLPLTDYIDVCKLLIEFNTKL